MQRRRERRGIGKRYGEVRRRRKKRRRRKMQRQVGRETDEGEKRQR